MSAVPTHPKIYHITPIANLSAITSSGWIRSDRAMLEQGGPPQSIGMTAIKRRRIDVLEVKCHPGTRVGDYVPFYFCPRSVMLYVISRANHPELSYRGGQEPILHLEADLHSTISWAAERGIAWAIALSNAGAAYTEYRSNVEDLASLDWDAIASRDFSAPEVKERKQAEFLLHGQFPFALVERVGVHSEAMRRAAAEALRTATHPPAIDVRPDWYF